MVDGLCFQTPIHVVFFCCCVSWNGMNEGRTDNEISEAIKTQLYYDWNLQQSLEGGRPPWAKIAAFLAEVWVLYPWIVFFFFFFSTRKLLLFLNMLRMFYLSEVSWEIVISFVFMHLFVFLYLFPFVFFNLVLFHSHLIIQSAHVLGMTLNLIWW